MNGHDIPRPEDRKHRWLRPVAGVSVIVMPVLLLLPLIVLLIAAILLYATVLYLVVWICWVFMQNQCRAGVLQQSELAGIHRNLHYPGDASVNGCAKPV